MSKPLPHTPTLDMWVEESIKQAQGKRQIALARKMGKEYEELKMHILEITQESNRDFTAPEG